MKLGNTAANAAKCIQKWSKNPLTRYRRWRARAVSNRFVITEPFRSISISRYRLSFITSLFAALRQKKKKKKKEEQTKKKKLAHDQISVRRNVLISRYNILSRIARAKRNFHLHGNRQAKNERIYKQSIARLKVYSELNSSNMIIAITEYVDVFVRCESMLSARSDSSFVCQNSENFIYTSNCFFDEWTL